MKTYIRQSCFLIAIFSLLLTMSGCDDEFYLSEKEVKAYQNVLVTEASANSHFDNLQGRTIDLQFNNGSGSPVLQSTNLLTEMRRTEMVNLESGPAAVQLDRL